MLQKLDDHIRACYERAADCAEAAKVEKDPNLKAHYLHMEKSWTQLGKSYASVESLERFLLDSHKRQLERSAGDRRSKMPKGKLEPGK
ncbi:MAG TPA: hypothetical protein VKV77_09610 [Methylovirgula sp.]|nr:hypothetical protein [Methylovirgula sp.]